MYATKNTPPKSHGVIDLHQLQLVSARKGISQHRIVLNGTTRADNSGGVRPFCPYIIQSQYNRWQTFWPDNPVGYKPINDQH